MGRNWVWWLALGIQISAFIYGYYVAGATLIFVDAGAWSNAAMTFALHFAIGIAVSALLRSGGLGQVLGFLVGLAEYIN